MPAVLTVVEAMRFAAHGLTPAVLADVELGGFRGDGWAALTLFNFFTRQGAAENLCQSLGAYATSPDGRLAQAAPRPDGTRY
ncbi:MAG TPA: hypothetical protein VGK99_01540 [Acidobacteriota bacterium]